MTLITDSKSLTPITPSSSAAAFRKVLAYNIIDIFDLTIEESIWATNKLMEVESILANYDANALPIAVTHEIRNKKYSQLLSQRAMSNNVRGSSVSYKGNVSPNKDAWIMFFLSPISESYRMPENETLRIRSVLDTVLTGLGVGAPKNPRGATKIPTELKLLIR